MLSKTTALILLITIAAALAAIGQWIGPIPQPQAYHNFADQRDFLGIVNGWNVLSNLLFALAGLWGLYLLCISKRLQFADSRERWLWMGVSVGLILTAIGSSYYHLSPDNSRLVWDRLPMTIIFMSLVAALIGERINIRLGLWLWPLLLVIGVYSVLTWKASELQGSGDLRFYVGLQIFTILVALVLMFAPTPYDRKWDLAVVIILFGLARFFEIYDHEIWIFKNGIVSGHTLKHLAAGMAGIWLIYMIWKRKIAHSEREYL